MATKSKAVPAIMAGLVALALGCAPANASIPEPSSSSGSPIVGSLVEAPITTKAAPFYVGPFRYGWECKGNANWMKLHGYNIVRGCVKHADGKWWYRARV